MKQMTLIPLWKDILVQEKIARGTGRGASDASNTETLSKKGKNVEGAKTV